MTQHNNPQDNVTVPRELLRQLLDALREIAWSNNSKWQSDRAQGMTEPLRAVLEQPAAEPVAELVDGPILLWSTHWSKLPIGTKFYTAPQAQPAPVQEPVAWMGVNPNGGRVEFFTEDLELFATDYYKAVPLYTTPQAQQPAPVQEPAPNPASEWRKLAHQFDAHRMQAIWHLKAMTQDPQAHMAKAVEFLSAPPQAQPAVEPVAYRYKYLNFIGEEVWRCELPRGGNVLETQPLYAAPQAQQPAQVVWGVDWGSHGDRSCVSIIKKHANGVHEIVATEYGPIGSAHQAQPRKAVKLTPDEKLRIALDCNMRVRTGSGAVKYANAVEDAFIAKNRMAE